MKDHESDIDSDAPDDQAQRGPFGRIPNSVALDPCLSAEALALLAYRLTKAGEFSLSVDAAARGLPLSKRSKGRTIGRSQFKRLIRELKRSGYLKRHQPHSRGRSSFGYAVETLHVPKADVAYRVCWEWWHDGSLTAKAIGGIIYFRAFNCAIAPSALRKRFNWGKATTQKVVRELLRSGLIIKLPGTKALYRDAEVANLTAFQKPSREETTDEKPSHEKPSSDRQTHTRIDRTPRNDQMHERDQRVRRSYGSDAEASNPKPFQGEAGRTHYAGPMVDPWESKRLLGWAKNDERGLAARLSCDELSRDTVAELESLASDDQIITMLRVATCDRVHTEILSQAGAETVRLLAAVLVEDEGLAPDDALNEILAFVEKRIGCRADQWLNSLKLVGLRVAGSIAAGEQGLHSDTRQMLSALGEVDFGNVLSPHLFNQPRRFKRLIKQYGDEAFDIIRASVVRASVEGKVPGSIKAWDYFEPALKEEHSKREMADGGLRPGDVFGLHRKFGQGNESS